MASMDEVSSVMNHAQDLAKFLFRIEEKWEERKKNENFSFVACSAPRAGTEAERGRRRRLGEHSRPGIKCSVAFVHRRFRFENHWQPLQHLDRRSQAEQSKIAGIGELLVRACLER